MSGTSPKAGETDGNPVSSASSAVLASNMPQQKQLQPKISQQPVPQQHHAVPNTTTSTTTDNGAPQQPLFLKPHPNPLQTYASAILAKNILTKPYSAVQAGITSPLTAAKTIVAALPKPAPASTAADPVISAPFNPHVARGQGVKEPLPTDVICGRGKMTASHPANRRFRELVDSHKAAYQNSKRRDEKTRITCELVDKLRAEGRYVWQWSL